MLFWLKPIRYYSSFDPLSTNKKTLKFTKKDIHPSTDEAPQKYIDLFLHDIISFRFFRRLFIYIHIT